MAVHTIHDNSLIGFGDSDLGNRGELDTNKHYDDVTGGNDVEFCGKFGRDSEELGSCPGGFVGQL